MRYVVIQDFQTPLRRFREGVRVDDADIDGPLTALEWVDRGYLGAAGPEAEEGGEIHHIDAAVQVAAAPPKAETFIAADVAAAAEAATKPAVASTDADAEVPPESSSRRRS